FALAIPLPFVTGTLCLPFGGFVSSILQGVTSIFTAALGIVTAPFTRMLTRTPDVTQWSEASDFFTYLWVIGGSIYGGFLVLAALHHYKRQVWGGAVGGPFLSLADAVTGALLLGALPWGIGQWLGLVNGLAADIN